jgi:hypothetical protein
MSVLELFCSVDDYWQQHMQPQQRGLLRASGRTRQRAGDMHDSEIMTLIIHFHQAHFRTFKAYYIDYVQVQLRAEFPKLVSYNRFVELMPRVLVGLIGYLRTRMGTCSGISFVDSTALPVCDNRRIHSHKVFEGLAARGKTSMGWFFGFKLHLVVSDCGELLAWYLSAGSTHDIKALPKLVTRLFGKLFGDAGYLSQPVFEQLFTDQHLQLVTKVRKNMKNRLMPLLDKLLLRKRALIETIIDQLKNISQVEHSRHRSPLNFLVNLVAGLIAYTLQPSKPSLHIRPADLALA